MNMAEQFWAMYYLRELGFFTLDSGNFQERTRNFLMSTRDG